MGDVTLYHWEPNANSGKPILAALEKGVEFESRYIDMLGFEQHSPEYLKVNPNGTIPAMVHDGVLGLMDAVQKYFLEANANTYGAFLTSRRTNEMISAARSAMEACTQQ